MPLRVIIFITFLVPISCLVYQFIFIISYSQLINSPDTGFCYQANHIIHLKKWSALAQTNRCPCFLM